MHFYCPVIKIILFNKNIENDMQCYNRLRFKKKYLNCLRNKAPTPDCNILGR